MDNPVTLATLGTRHRTKTNKTNTTRNAKKISNMDLVKTTQKILLLKKPTNRMNISPVWWILKEVCDLLGFYYKIHVLTHSSIIHYQCLSVLINVHVAHG